MESAIYHIPAMLKETIEGLAIKPGGVYVDVTFGGGGHSRAILAKLHEITNYELTIKNEATDGKNAAEVNGGHLYSFDQDIEAYENAKGRMESGKMDEAINGGKNATEQNNEGEAAEYRREQDNGGETGLMNREQSEEWDEEKWTFVHSNFRYLKNWMDYYGVEQIDGLLADLGVSFHHFDCPERGFSFRYPAPLDMRMNQTAKRTAADIVNSYSEEELARLFWLYGEMKNGRGIARNICKARAQKPILRTEELINAALNLQIQALAQPSRREGGRMVSCKTDEAINGGKNATEQDNSGEAAEYRREQNSRGAGNPSNMTEPVELDIPAQYKKDLARLFQALRIEVNDEMGALREMLVAARDMLKPGGRIAVLTYHSLEDRLVKNFLRSGNLEGNIEKDFYGKALTPFDVIEKGLTASPDEVERNPRSRSAKLRVAEKK